VGFMVAVCLGLWAVAMSIPIAAVVQARRSTRLPALDIEIEAAIDAFVDAIEDGDFTEAEYVVDDIFARISTESDDAA
jgi:hypothetical protein